MFNTTAVFHELVQYKNDNTELKKVVTKAVKDAVKEHLDDINLGDVTVEIHDVDRLNLQIKVKTPTGTRYYGVKVSESW